MKKDNKLRNAVALFALFSLIFGLSFLFIKSTAGAGADYEIFDVGLNDFLLADELEIADNFEVVDLDSDITEYAADGKKIEYSNKYGDFTFNATKKGKVKKYTDNSLKNGYLIKGSGTFKKCDITFSGSFYVNESGRVMFYKGKMELPKGDSYDGTFFINEKGNSYKKGTYTWKNGDSYKGAFDTVTVSDSSGTKTLKSCLDSGDSKGYYYFGSKKEYLYIKFHEGKPTGKGTYCKNDVKYTVKYDSNGKCTSTKKK